MGKGRKEEKEGEEGKEKMWAKGKQEKEGWQREAGKTGMEEEREG